MALTVLFPTPPFPLNTNTLCLTSFNLSLTASRSGSGPFGAVAHVSWFGHPAHPGAEPAERDSVPCLKGRLGQRGVKEKKTGERRTGQCSGASLWIASKFESVLGAGKVRTMSERVSESVLWNV